MSGFLLQEECYFKYYSKFYMKINKIELGDWKDRTDIVGTFCIKIAKVKKYNNSFIYISPDHLSPNKYYVVNFYGKFKFLYNIYNKSSIRYEVNKYSLDEMKDKVDNFILSYEKLLVFL